MDSFIFNSFKERLMNGEVKADDTWKMYCVNSKFSKDFNGTPIKSFNSLYEINKASNAYASSGLSANENYEEYRSADGKHIKHLILESNYSSKTELRSRYIENCIPVYYVYRRSRETNSSDKPTFVDENNWDDFIKKYSHNSHLYGLFLNKTGQFYRGIKVIEQNEYGEDVEVEVPRGFYYVLTAEELRWCADLVNDESYQYNNYINIVLGDNIGTETPNGIKDNKIINFSIGTNPAHPFQGIFYGNGFLIKNIELQCTGNTNGIIANLGTEGVITTIRIAGSNVMNNQKKLSLTHMTEDCCDINSGLLCGKNNGVIKNVDVLHGSKTYIKGFCPEIYPVSNKTDKGGNAFDYPGSNKYFPNHLCFNSPGNIVPYIGYFAEGVFASNAYGKYREQYSKSYWNSINLYNRNTVENAYDTHRYLEWSYPKVTNGETGDITAHALYYDLATMQSQYPKEGSWNINGQLVGEKDGYYKIKETPYSDVSMKMHAVNRISYNTGILIGCNNGHINNVVLENKMIFDYSNVGFFGGLAGKDTSHCRNINNVYIDLTATDLHHRDVYETDDTVTFDSVAAEKNYYILTPDAQTINIKPGSDTISINDPIIQVGLYEMRGASVEGFKVKKISIDHSKIFPRFTNNEAKVNEYATSFKFDKVKTLASVMKGADYVHFDTTSIELYDSGITKDDEYNNEHFADTIAYLKVSDYRSKNTDISNMFNMYKNFNNSYNLTYCKTDGFFDDGTLYFKNYSGDDSDSNETGDLIFKINHVDKTSRKYSVKPLDICMFTKTGKRYKGKLISISFKTLQTSKQLNDKNIETNTFKYNYKTYGYSFNGDSNYNYQNSESTPDYIVVSVDPSKQDTGTYDTSDNEFIYYYKINVRKWIEAYDRFDFGYVGTAGIEQTTPSVVKFSGGMMMTETKNYKVVKRSIKNVGAVFGSLVLGNANTISNLSANLYNDELYAFTYYKNMLAQGADAASSVGVDFFKSTTTTGYETTFKNNNTSAKIIRYTITGDDDDEIEAPTFSIDDTYYGAIGGAFTIKPSYNVVSVYGELMYAYDNLRLPRYDYDYTFNNRYGTLAAMCEVDSSNISDAWQVSKGQYDKNLVFNQVHLKYGERPGYLSGDCTSPTGAVLFKGIRELQYYNNAWTITGNTGLNGGLTGIRCCPYGVASPFIAELKPTCILFPTINACPGSNNREYVSAYNGDTTNALSSKNLYERAGLTKIDQVIGSPTNDAVFHSINTLVDLPNGGVDRARNFPNNMGDVSNLYTLKNADIMISLFTFNNTTFYKPTINNGNNNIEDLRYFGMGYKPFTTIPWNYSLSRVENSGTYTMSKIPGRYHYYGSDLYLNTNDIPYSHKSPIETEHTIVEKDIDDGTVSSHGEFVNLFGVIEYSDEVKYITTDIFNKKYADSVRNNCGIYENYLWKNVYQANTSSAASGIDVFKYSYYKSKPDTAHPITAMSVKVSLTDISANGGEYKYGYVFQDSYFKPEYNNDEINYDGSILHMGTTLTEDCVLHQLQRNSSGYVSASGIKTEDFDGLLVVNSLNQPVMYIDTGFGNSDGSRSWSLNCSTTKSNTYAAWSAIGYEDRSRVPNSGLLLELNTTPNSNMSQSLMDTYATMSAEIE